jgi:sugar lactone lactonase YvrE
VLDRVSTLPRQAYACMLGGPERRTLYVCTAFGSDPEKCAEEMGGQIECVDVDVPGAGLP